MESKKWEERSKMSKERVAIKVVGCLEKYAEKVYRQGYVERYS